MDRGVCCAAYLPLVAPASASTAVASGLPAFLIRATWKYGYEAQGALIIIPFNNITNPAAGPHQACPFMQHLSASLLLMQFVGIIPLITMRFIVMHQKDHSHADIASMPHSWNGISRFYSWCKALPQHQSSTSTMPGVCIIPSWSHSNQSLHANSQHV